MLVITASCPLSLGTMRRVWLHFYVFPDTSLYQAFWEEGKDHLFRPVGNTLPDVAQGGVGLPRYKGVIAGSCWTCFSPGSAGTFLQSRPWTLWDPDSPFLHSWGPSEWQNSRVMYQPLLQVLDCMPSCWGCTSVLLSRSLMEVLSSIDHWGAPLTPGLQLVCVTLQNPVDLAVQPVLSPLHCSLI